METAEAANVVVDPKTLRVLVIDSKTASRNNVVDLLEECAYKVSSVRTAKEALELLSSSAAGDADGNPPFHLLLKEHEPDRTVNACRLLGRIAQSDLLRRIPVVVMSSHDEREAVLRCLHLGAADYLVKPLRVNELRHIWTRVWWHRVMNAPRAQGASQLHEGLTPAISAAAAAGFATSFSGSDGTKIEDDDEPTSKEGSAPNAMQCIKPNAASAARNSTTKPGSGRIINGDGSNTANGHGSNIANGNGASTTHVYASHAAAGTADAPVIYGSVDDRGEGSGGSGGSRGGGNGSGQGSGSGNEDLAQRRLASDSPQLPDDAAGAADKDTDGGAANKGNGSNGNSGIGNSGGDAAANAKRDSHEARALRGTAQGKRTAAPPETPGSHAHNASLSPKAAAADGIASVADAAAAEEREPAPVGFRAWVGPQHAAGDDNRPSLKRGASASAALLPPPPRSMKAAKSLGAASPGAALATTDRLNSATPTGTTPTGASDGTHFGNSGTLANSNMRRNSSATTRSSKGSQLAVTSAMVPPSGSSHAQMPAPVASQSQVPASNGAQSSPHPAAAAAAAAAWGLQQMQQLQVAAAAAAQQHHQHAQQQQHPQQQAQSQQSAGYSNGSFQYGGMPPHMVPPNFAPMPFAWGGFAPMQQSQGSGVSMQQQAMAYGQQAMQQQQQQQQMNAAIMAGYHPGYFMNSFGMGAGYAANLQAASWAQASMQQAAAAQAQMQQQQQQQNGGGLPPKPRGPSSATAKQAPPHQGNSHQHHNSRAGTPSIVVPENGEGAGADENGGHTPTQRERRAQALTKYKQKRKNLCFTKKIRYESRKQLAQARPRVKGQFVRVTSSGMELVDGAADGPMSPSALAAAVDAALEEEEDCLDGDEDCGKVMAVDGAADDAAGSDVDSDNVFNSPRSAAAAEAAPALWPMVRQTRSHSGKGQAAAAMAACNGAVNSRPAPNSGPNVPQKRRGAAKVSSAAR